MKRFFDLIRTPKPTSASLREALADADIDAAKAGLARVESDYRRVLIEGDDAALDLIEAELTKARRNIDRIVIARDEISARLAEAEVREADEALTAERDRVEAEATAVAKALKNTYPKLANEMTSLLNRLMAAEDAVQEVNTKIFKAMGSNEGCLSPVEPRAFPIAGVQQVPEATSVLTRTQLPTIQGLTEGYRDPGEVMYPMIQNPTGAGYTGDWGRWS